MQSRLRLEDQGRRGGRWGRRIGSGVSLLCLLVFQAHLGSAQRRYSVGKPRERVVTEAVEIRTANRISSTKGVLVVLVEPVLPGQIVVKTRSGRELARAEADAEKGQAEFTLPRGAKYLIEASYPGYQAVATVSPLLGVQAVSRIRLLAESASVKLRDLPSGARVQINGEVRATSPESGTVVISGLRPGSHLLQVRHPEFNDFDDTFVVTEAGEEVNYPRLPLTRTAKLTFQAPPGATVLIDGAVRGKIPPEGQVLIEYELPPAEEQTLTVELVGYHPWRLRERLLPGPRSVKVDLAPIVTSTGTSDFFDGLVQWEAPPTWRVLKDARNSRLEVQGTTPGLLKEQLYRNFEATFTLWLPDGQGAAWVVRANRPGSDYYLFHLTGPNARTGTPRRFSTYLVRAGNPPEEVGTPAPLLVDLAPNASYTIGVTVRDFTIQHTITSNETGETNDLGIWTDTSPSREAYLFGTFGFRALHEEIFLVDDFHIVPLQIP